MELSEGEKIIQEAIRRKKEDEKRERKCNQELKCKGISGDIDISRILSETVDAKKWS